MRLLSGLLRSFIKRGQMRVYDVKGALHSFGSGDDGPTVTIRLHDKKLYRSLFLNPELAAGEAYMNGTLTMEQGSSCYDFLFLFSINRAPLGAHPVQSLLRKGWKSLRRHQQKNSVERAKKQARHHYDLSTDLYRLFLEGGLNYSCAYYRSADDTLEDAQEAKLTHLVAKLDLKPGMRVLEIGGGWGSLAIRMAQAGAKVTSLNVSPEQVNIAKQRTIEAGLDDRVEFLLKDYREFEGKFDRVISVGMMEHVGIGHLDAYFAKVGECLSDNGFAVIHSIGRMTPPGTTGPFIRKYIFPGGYVPALSEVFASTERLGLWVCDAEVLRLHYYYTIRDWRGRFEARHEEVKALYDEKFCRMWEFYLCAVELGFLHGSNMVFQLMLSKERDAVPLLRDFTVDNERAMNSAKTPVQAG
ncbi:Cyclopropane-fatty-acyl-phospholipid synthase [Pseudovibrio axinellae]|uniref:Cyclopropane-fatty-acyl-phospholipid synthase n=1 Tax=Pseudovibrio axinellae TaxID=989403 RepID=A0A165XIN7_9HYPH|nr:cyclopropane-fatty-acyl-phospholipid synthase family protein [Pseudovibrio axinellae]KZL17739.1 Cyclopropane-fatty-acyl-phospholipid synthase [Pseudovibrio axinellae]SER41720.1 cyclopropane-fatty-acyl-phospholipid synthase [Pseudovibrio axinellae]